MSRARIAIAAVSLSAAAWALLVEHEEFTSSAVIPTQGDRPTYGIGSTFKADGTPVKMGDTITPTQAIRLSIQHVAKDETRLKQCVRVDVLQGEYDQLVKHAYQFGPAATCTSSIVDLLNQQRYLESCEAHLEWRKITPGPIKPHQGVLDSKGKYDCSQLVNGRPNRMCWGVWVRAKERRDSCMRANGALPSLGATG